jgi:hypothetical protein
LRVACSYYTTMLLTCLEEPSYIVGPPLAGGLVARGRLAWWHVGGLFPRSWAAWWRVGACSLGRGRPGGTWAACSLGRGRPGGAWPGGTWAACSLGRGRPGGAWPGGAWAAGLLPWSTCSLAHARPGGAWGGCSLGPPVPSVVGGLLAPMPLMQIKTLFVCEQATPGRQWLLR